MKLKISFLILALLSECSSVDGFTSTFRQQHSTSHLQPYESRSHSKVLALKSHNNQEGEKKIKTEQKEEKDINAKEDSAKFKANLFSSLNGLSRRTALKTAAVTTAAGLNAETAWRQAVNTAAHALETESPSSQNNNILPPGTLQQIEAGKAVIIPNWLTKAETTAICNDVRDCFQKGHFTNFILSRNPNKADKAANDRWIMPSFSKTQDGTNGPFVNPNIGNYKLRNALKFKMAQVKALLAKEMTDRPTLADDTQTHEMEYLRYGEGALLARHVDEHHLELKRPNGSKLPLKPNASRRSITWLIYLNDDWDGEVDGGHLRVHERKYESVSPVGARRNDLQVGWLRATSDGGGGKGEQPVFLDPSREGPENETCMLYTIDANGIKRDLSSKPFANIALYLAGGDKMARSLMVSNSEDAKRLHLIDAPKSLVSGLTSKVASPPADGEDGGELIRDIVPRAGTLVMFDSVSLPHEVMQTNRERFGVQGWFHEKIYT